MTSFDQHKTNVLGMGTRLKLVFAQPSPNVLAEKSVGFSLLRIWGQPLAYYRGVVNHEIPLAA